ncbi:jg24021 [Pararge aegeria aegeria]|uniref:Jg24021 protein n=1 Tax=Pararge aegeria aegeria TaxID=348720 RepID=A0A8S4S9G3_9NEOP|nr:jg24021 [Pararge aegeria aegeria]
MSLASTVKENIVRKPTYLRVLHNLLKGVLFNPKTPSYLKEKFKFLGVQSELRSSRALTFSMPFHKTKFYKHSFTVKATELWNALPLNIRQSKSLGIFKNAVKAHYLAQ